MGGSRSNLISLQPSLPDCIHQIHLKILACISWILVEMVNSKLPSDNLVFTTNIFTTKEHENSHTNKFQTKYSLGQNNPHLTKNNTILRIKPTLFFHSSDAFDALMHASCVTMTSFLNQDGPKPHNILYCYSLKDSPLSKS